MVDLLHEFGGDLFDLPSADKARFAEDTIRRIYSLGRFDTIAYGG